jgi:tetratricopeptide (TPR) repeat protein
MWNSGERTLSVEYADILSAVFGVRFIAGKNVSRPPEISRRKVLAAAAIISASARQSSTLIERLAATVDPVAIEQFGEDVDRLAVEYIASPPVVIAHEAKTLRDGITIALERTRRPRQIQDLYLLAGRLSGILAYAALDLGNPSAAMANARSALMCADLAGHQGLEIWVRGTQSWIARFARRYEDAERYLQDGMKLAPRGTGLARLASGQAQCRAHLGDVAGTRNALRAALDAHDSAGELLDAQTGLFGFPRSKVHFYAASSLIWLPDSAGAREATREAAMAVKLFRVGPATERFVTDEILSYVYGATAYLQQGQIDAAKKMLKPVFDTPPDQRVSWHRERLGRIAKILQSPKLSTSRTAVELQAAIAAF